MAYAYAVNVTATSNASLLPSTQTDWPVLVKLSATELKTVANGGQIQNTVTFNGQTVPPDFACWSDVGYTTSCKFDIFSYDASGGVVWLFVKVPSLALSTVLYFKFGDASVTLYQGGAVGDAWPASAAGIWHLPNGTALSLKDSTANGNNGSGVNTPTATTGQVDGAMALVQASTQYANIGHAASLAPTAISLVAWVNATSFPDGYNAILSRVGASSVTFWQLFVKSTGKLAIYLSATGPGVDYDGSGSHTLSTSTWYRITATYSSAAGLVGYVNGASDATVAANGALQTGFTTFDATIGYDLTTTPRGWNGSIGGAQVWNVALTADQITIDYQSQLSPTTFWTQGSVTPVGGSVVKNLSALGVG